MAAKLIFLKGLPGSGKSTWALRQVRSNTLGEQLHSRSGVVRVNKDEIRDAMRKEWSPKMEKEVLRIRDFKISEGLSKGLTVISDDTNFAPKHEARLREIAKKYKADFELSLTFLAVSVETCIERDAAREFPVGEKVIRDMAAQWLPPAPPPIVPYTWTPDLSTVVICDLDGTIALHNGRSPFNYELCYTDLLNKPVADILRSVQAHCQFGIVFMSGRDDSCRAMTELWLIDHGFINNPLFMRKAGDKRNDAIVKLELFNAHIRGTFNVAFTLDDRDRVVKLWRDLGLTCLQVNYGDF